MITLKAAEYVARKEMPKFEVAKRVKYKNYFVFFMQPGGIDPSSNNSVMDSYVFVDANTGNVEYLQPWAFDDFPDKAVVIG